MSKWLVVLLTFNAQLVLLQIYLHLHDHPLSDSDKDDLQNTGEALRFLSRFVGKDLAWVGYQTSGCEFKPQSVHTTFMEIGHEIHGLFKNYVDFCCRVKTD